MVSSLDNVIQLNECSRVQIKFSRKKVKMIALTFDTEKVAWLW